MIQLPSPPQSYNATDQAQMRRIIAQYLNALTGSTATVSPVSTGVGSWLPVVDGAEPAHLLTDGAGRLVTVWYEP